MSTPDDRCIACGYYGKAHADDCPTAEYDRGYRAGLLRAAEIVAGVDVPLSLKNRGAIRDAIRAKPPKARKVRP
jgi:hypothetical protein